MLERGGHWGRHYIAPLAKATPMGPLARIRAALGLRNRTEARRHILPGQGMDAHAAGWQAPAMPNKKAPEAVAAAKQGHRTNVTVIITHPTEKCKGESV